MFTSLSLNLTKQQQQKNTTNNNHLKIDQYINVQCKLKFFSGGSAQQKRNCPLYI